MAEGFQFMPWGLVRLRTFGSVHGLLRCNIKTGVHVRAQSGHVTQRCHNSPAGKQRLVSANDVTHRKRAEDFGRFWKSQSWVLPREKTVGFRLLAETFMTGATCWWGGRWKSQYRKIVSLSLCRRTFKLKGNKKVRTWTEKSLSVFRISRSYVLCIYAMNVPCTFHIFVYMAMVQWGKDNFCVCMPGSQRLFQHCIYIENRNLVLKLWKIIFFQIW